MNTALLIDQLAVAVLASIIALALIQKIKGGFPEKWISLLSGVTSLVVGALFAYYYRGYDLLACLIVGLYTFIGADGLYKTFSEKLKSYTEIKASNIIDETDRVG